MNDKTHAKNSFVVDEDFADGHGQSAIGKANAEHYTWGNAVTDGISSRMMR